ncbi:MAG: hypothetical protein IJ808_08835 [Muribaculaceae bacterium]|nr:hypothetical protein [Muribaculaceae bacterium]
MKRIVITGLLLVLVVVAGDRFIGSLLSWGYHATTCGEIGRLNEVLDSVETPIVVVGSSRALHHYVPSVISDSTGLECYNCGFEGEQVQFYYALLRQLHARYSPQLIVCELTYDMDVDDLPWNVKLNHLRMMDRLSCRDSILCSYDPLERVSLLSAIYPYNSLLPIIAMSQKPDAYDAPDVDNGYMPQYRIFDDKRLNGEFRAKKTESVDSVKWSYLTKLVKEYGDKLIMFVSPRYMSKENDIYGEVENLCATHGVPFYCFVDHPVISTDITLWDDDGHMNDRGARAYSQMVAPLIKQRLLQIQNKKQL